MNDALLLRLNNRIASTERDLEAWIENMRANPILGFTWAAGAVESGVRLALLKRAASFIENGHPVENVTNELFGTIWHRAQQPPSSSSPYENLVEQAKATQAAWILRTFFGVDGLQGTTR